MNHNLERDIAKIINQEINMESKKWYLDWKMWAVVALWTLVMWAWLKPSGI